MDVVREVVDFDQAAVVAVLRGVVDFDEVDVVDRLRAITIDEINHAAADAADRGDVKLHRADGRLDLLGAE